MFNNSMFGERAKFTANTVIAQDSTANTNLDGTGTLTSTIVAAANGTYINSIIIKTTTAAAQGMVRLFLYNKSTNKLLEEIQIDPHVAGTGTWKSCAYTILADFFLNSGFTLKVGVENADTFNIIVDGYDISYP